MFAPALQRTVSVNVTGNASQYNAAMAGALKGTTSFMNGVNKALLAVTALGGVIGGLSVKSASDFQAAMSRVKAISGATAKQFFLLTKEAKRLGAVSHFTMVEIAQGMEEYSRAGYNATQVVQGMGGAVALAASQGTGLAETILMVTRAQKGMGLASSESERIANLFAATASSAALKVNELSEAYTQLAPTAKILNLTVEDLSGTIAQLAEGGLVGTKATTTLSSSLLRIAKPTAEAQKWLKRLRIELFDAEGQFMGMPELIDALSGSLSQLTTEQQLQAVGSIFTARSARNWLTLINQGPGALQEMIDKITDTNAAFDQQKTILDNVKGAWVLMTSSLNALWTTLGEPGLGVIQKGLEWLKRLIDEITAKIAKIQPYIQAFFETLYSYVSANRKAIGFLLMQFANIAKVVGVIAGVALAFKLLMSPITWLIAGAFLFYAAWESNLFNIQKKIEDFGNVVSSIVSLPIQFLLTMSGAEQSAQNVGNFFDTLLGKITAVVGTFVLGKALIAGLFTGGMLTGGKLLLPLAALLTIGWDIANVYNTFKQGNLPEGLQGAGRLVGSVLGAVLGFVVGGIPGAAIGAIAGHWTAVGIQYAVDAVLKIGWTVDSMIKETNIPALIDVLPQTGVPSNLDIIHKAKGGFIPGVGEGDIIPAMMEPGEFVVPKWMMQIPWLSSLITRIWNSGERRAIGGPATISSGIAGGGATNVESGILNTLDKILQALLPHAENQEWLIEAFGNLGDLITSAYSFGDEYKQLAADLVAQQEAMEKMVEETEKQAEAISDTVPDIDGFGDALTEQTDYLNKIQGYLSQLPGQLGMMATAVINLVQSIQSADWGGIASSIGNILLAGLRMQLEKLQEKLAGLQEKLAEQQKIMDFYISSINSFGQSLSGAASSFGILGSALSAIINLLTSSVAMINLEGIDLLNAGFAALSSFITATTNVLSNLISKGKAYSAIQEESKSIWQTIGDLLGEFLWPIVGAIRYLKEWLGIQEEVNESMAEVGVPSMWKRALRAFESASPGTPYVEPAQTAIPEWARELGIQLGQTIQQILQGWGFSSIEDTLTRIREYAASAWNWIISVLPAFVSNTVAFLQQMWSVLTAIYQWGLNLWGQVGGWPGILAKWEEFKQTLLTLPTWNEVKSEMDRLVAAIDSTKQAIESLEQTIKNLGIIIAIAAAALAIVQAIGLLSGVLGAGGAAAGVAGAASAAGGAGGAGAAAITGSTLGKLAWGVAGVGTVLAVANPDSAINQFAQGTVKPWLDKNVAPIMHTVLDPVGEVLSGIGRGISGILGGIGKALGFAEGGIISSPTFGMLGEGKYSEAVLPLSNRVLQRVGEGIASAMQPRTPSMAFAGNVGLASPGVSLSDLRGSTQHYREDSENRQTIIHVYLGENELTDVLVDRIQEDNRRITGQKGVSAVLNRRQW